MNKTILVTGGAGFIGSNFIYMLLEERPEWKIVCVDALTYAANIHTLNDAMKKPNFVFYKEDIRNRAGILRSSKRSIPMSLSTLQQSRTLTVPSRIPAYSWRLTFSARRL